MKEHYRVRILYTVLVFTKANTVFYINYITRVTCLQRLIIVYIDKSGIPTNTNGRKQKSAWKIRIYREFHFIK